VVNRLQDFNIGIELGQIAVLVAITLLLGLIRKAAAFKPFSKIANSALVMMGYCLFFLQMNAYLHTVHPNDFSFSGIDH